MPNRRPATASDDAPRLFVDTSAWIALTSRRDRRHGDAVAMFEAAEARRARLITTDLVVAETHRLLLFRAGPRAALHVLDRIHANPRVTVEFATAELHQRAREWLVRLGDQAISYTDAMSFALMEGTRIGAALTLDHDFVMAGFNIWRAQ